MKHIAKAADACHAVECLYSVSCVFRIREIWCFRVFRFQNTLASVDFWNYCIAIVKYPRGKIVIAHVISRLIKIKNPQKYLHI